MEVCHYDKHALSLSYELLPVLESPAAEMMEEDGHGGQGAERAPLASEEGMEESPIQLSDTEVEITREGMNSRFDDETITWNVSDSFAFSIL